MIVKVGQISALRRAQDLVGPVADGLEAFQILDIGHVWFLWYG